MKSIRKTITVKYYMSDCVSWEPRLDLSWSINKLEFLTKGLRAELICSVRDLLYILPFGCSELYFIYKPVIANKTLLPEFLESSWQISNMALATKFIANESEEWMATWDLQVASEVGAILWDRALNLSWFQLWAISVRIKLELLDT